MLSLVHKAPKDALDPRASYQNLERTLLIRASSLEMRANPIPLVNQDPDS